jgi:lipopolysaccharide/colanic/teichoic acid biosynthesis glycosyltransferase
MRRFVDIATALVVGVLAAPVLAAVALLVLVTMGRPVLFRQERCGLHGRIFFVVKFRTMRESADPGEGDAERTPAVGRFLRVSSLDELPQLWNILRGDMSLIGPRPTLPDQVERYSDHERGRLVVRPGLTGWAQVNGRNGISWPARIELDLWYIAHRSLVLDLKIIWYTVLRLLRPTGITGAGGINPGFPGPSETPHAIPTAGPAVPAPRKSPEASSRVPAVRPKVSG